MVYGIKEGVCTSQKGRREETRSERDIVQCEEQT